MFHKTLLLLLLSLPASAATVLQTQDIGTSNITFSGSETFGSSITLSGMVLGLHNHQFVSNFSASSNGPTTLGVCYATATITSSGTNPLRISYTGPLENTTGSRYTAISFLVDGVFPPGLSTTVPVFFIVGTEQPANGSFVWTTVGYNPGVHNVCLTLATNAGVGNACNSVSTSGSGFTPTCQFGVEEVK